MSINDSLFEQVYDECCEIINSSNDPFITAKKKKLDFAYKLLCNKQDAELQEFYSIVHELRTFFYLLSNGCHITAENDSHKGPDFYCEELGYIECVSITKGEIGTEARMYVDKTLSGSFNRYKAALPRISSVIVDKKNKYNRYLESGVIDKKKPRIIAINTSVFSNILHSDAIIDLCMRVLFGIGDQMMEFELDPVKPIENDVELHRYDDIGKKDFRRDLQLNYFSLEGFKNISAIIVENNSIGEMLKKQFFTFFVNPLAEVPLPQSLLNCAQYFIACDEGKYKVLK